MRLYFSVTCMRLNSFCYLGLRGRMEAGWARMNDLIIIQASQVIISSNHIYTS